MEKSKLFLCWKSPEYTTNKDKDGSDHNPRFSTDVVNVHGEVSATPASCMSAKEAEAPNTAQVLPLLPLSPFPSSLPTPSPGLLAIKLFDANTKPAEEEEVPQESCQDTQTSLVINMTPIGSGDKDKFPVYKNQLQQYAQKENLDFPVYTSEAQGPLHALRFKSRVSIGGKSYETSEFFPTLKKAEQAAAKVACQVLLMDATQEDGGFYKNLLQEFTQKKGLQCPSYTTVSSGLSHRPIFASTVVVGTDTFQGAEARTKKQAEMNAAKVAYYALTEGCAATKSLKVSSINECHVADNLSQNIQPVATIRKHQDTPAEEAHLRAKRAKSCAPENMNMDSHLRHPSHSNPPSDGPNFLYSRVEDLTSAEPVTKQTVENQPLLQGKLMVYRCKSSLPVPESDSIMPYSNNQVAYKVELEEEGTA